ncbi:hypothetical protein RJ640_020499 [Escallonia rubra]|uniref:Uncharacterized protein n=1 Tax=Escallonia rubra TaxID=112253 RepID=A0AA88R434_9ASTE|nr:hypothetical protein RJ640_020499 [Escallonia rubra]
MSPLHRVLHLILCSNLSAHSGSYATFSYLDIILVTHFIQGSPLNIAGIIMLVMNARKNKSSANLPFGLLLTRIFEHFHVPLPTSNSERIPLLGHHVLHETSLRRDGFAIRSDLTSNTVSPATPDRTTSTPGKGFLRMVPSPTRVGIPDTSSLIDKTKKTTSGSGKMLKSGFVGAIQKANGKIKDKMYVCGALMLSCFKMAMEVVAQEGQEKREAIA